MTTENNKLTSRIQGLGESQEQTVGVPRDGFADPTGEFPKREYHLGNSINKAARGEQINELKLGGGDLGVALDLKPVNPSIFPFNDVNETLSGHIIELDDTPGNERILIKHRTGAGIELKSDGAVVVSALNNKVEVTGGDHTVIVEGRGKLVYKGNLDLTVSGDMNVNVGGNYSLKVAGNVKETIIGSRRAKITKNQSFLVRGSNDIKVCGENTGIYLRGNNQMCKGTQKNYVEGGVELTSEVGVFISGRDEFSVSTKKANITGQSVSMWGMEGTIGGQNVDHFGKVFSGPTEGSGHGEGTTFYGTLVGCALEAINSKMADVAGWSGQAQKALFAISAGRAPTGSPAPVEPTIVIPPKIFPPITRIPDAPMPNLLLTSAYLMMSSYAIRKVSIDTNNELYDSLVKTDDYDGILDHEPTVAEVRAKMRNPANVASPRFAQSLIKETRLNPNWASTKTPPKIGRVVTKEPAPRFGVTLIGNNPVENRSKRFTPAQRVSRSLLVDPIYNPAIQNAITPATKLAPGISIAKFLGAPGSQTSFDHIENLEERRQIARNLYAHAYLMKLVTDNDLFPQHRLVVTEGIYKPGPRENFGGGASAENLAQMAQTGRLIGYQMVGVNGAPDPEVTFDLAEFWKDYALYDKLILDYDTISPNNTLSCQVLMLVPQMSSDFTGIAFNFEVMTTFNGALQTRGLSEIMM